MLALLLVDLQNDFLPGGALAVPDGDAVIPVANRLISEFDLVVATQDWHPADHLSFASQHDRPVGTQIDLDGLPQVLWPDHCVQESPGAAFAAALRHDAITEVFRKGTDRHIDSYSGFYDNGHRQSTGLARWLRARGVRCVFVLGLATDYCVRFTALDAIREGFETWLISDGCRGVNLQPGDDRRALDALRATGAQTITSDELLAMLPDLREDQRRTDSYGDRVLARHRYLELIERGHWEFAARHGVTGAVALVAITPEGRLLLVEQLRLPHGRRVLELPAGIVGDEVTDVPEEPAATAARELIEETGYEAGTLRWLTHGPTSAGFSNEAVTLFAATDLRRIGDGGGVDREEIRVHEVDPADAPAWLTRQIRRGLLVDPKVYAGLYFAERLGRDASVSGAR